MTVTGEIMLEPSHSDRGEDVYGTRRGYQNIATADMMQTVVWHWDGQIFF
jgi:hypothetical protein